MPINHRIAGPVFAVGIGLAVAFLSYRWITDPTPRIERQLQEAAVMESRGHLAAAVGNGLEIVDPLAPDRQVGKVYVYRSGDGWEVSGYYRREGDAGWQPFLMTLAPDRSLRRLRVSDPALAASENPSIEILP